MASVNKVHLLGRLGRDPEIRYMPSGDAIANIAVATSYKPKDKPEVVEWHRISFFGRLAEVVRDYLKKGSSVYVEGRLQTRKYTDKDGVEKYTTEIVAENMQMLGDRQESQPAPAPAAREETREQKQERQRPAPAPSGRGASGFDDLEGRPF